jgi:hypothetical protein
MASHDIASMQPHDRLGPRRAPLKWQPHFEENLARVLPNRPDIFVELTLVNGQRVRVRALSAARKAAR